MAKFLDLTGQKFGKLEVIKLSRNVKSGKRYRKYWLCKCECGNNKEIRTDCLTGGGVKSCGCLKKEQDKKNLTDKFRYKAKYNIVDERLRGIWQGMKSRCLDKSNKSFYRYGGRGITLCNEWLDFNVFADWALSNGYKETLTIDRIDNSGNYKPSNCRWITNKEQCRNRRTNHLVNYKGEKITLIELSEKTGIPYGVIASRAQKGWLDHDLTKPICAPEEARSKLSKNEVLDIRSKYNKGVPIKTLCDEYSNVTRASIENIVHNRTWKNI